ncbi:hypothetical protein PLICRDRAFT_463898 [Plicaturopsis crispa FD-325 SS-3]|nr:hypothetical protein PLICRDRAFT_463898 [Plicaturopsis crispa FD-325 SS-3]
MPQHQAHLTSYSGRFTLIPPNPGDDQAVASLRSHPTIRAFLKFLPEHLSPEDARILRETRAKDPCIVNFNVHDTATGTFVGQCGLTNIDALNDKCEVGILVAPEFHGKGAATEILHALFKFTFEERGLHRAEFDVAVNNVGMRGWLENVARISVEHQKRECWKEGPGRYVDVVGYSILAWEWRDLIRSRLERKMDAARSE